jgi:serine/threonine protein kinase
MSPVGSLLDGTDFEVSDRDPLGKGAYGVLYRGRERSSGRDVAVRILGPSDGQSTSILLGRIRQYAELLTPLKACGIVPILGTGEWRGNVFYAMELVVGDSLSTCIAQSHRFTTDEILYVAEGTVLALQGAWKSGVAPCGIKPSNIFLSEKGAVRMADVGLAKCLSQAIPFPLGRAQGRYVAPEEALGEPPEIRSDLYSLGVILYELSTRKLPFEGYDSSTSFYYQLLHVAPASPRELGASIPRELERIVLRCMAKSPSDRYQTPQELLEELKALHRAQQSTTKVVGIPEDDTGDFDVYEDQVIAEGGMGILYRGRQHSLGRPVAIKVIRDVFTASPEFVQRFRQEAELLAQVNHPNVVQVFGTGTWRGRLFYAMELVDGQDVAARLREKGKFSPDEVLQVAEGVARALGAAWKFRIVHRDIKPSNILYGPGGTIKVADFGLAKSLRIPRSDSRLIAGTSEYISPEQGLGQPVDIRSDVYSLGVVLYELLVGRPPFKSDGSFTFVLYQHVHASPPPLERMIGARDIPDSVREIIQKCLEKDPPLRYQTPEELLEAVLLARTPKPSLDPRRPAGKDARAPGSPPEPRPRGPLPPRALKPLGILLGLVAAAGGLFAILHFHRASDPSHSETRDYDLLLGVGEFEAAARLAEGRWGRNSREYEIATRRRSEYLRNDLERRSQEAIRQHAWDEASAILERALREAQPDRERPLVEALELCREMIRARGLEESHHPQEAVDLYLRTSTRAPFLADYCRERIGRLTREPGRAPEKE